VGGGGGGGGGGEKTKENKKKWYIPPVFFFFFCVCFLCFFSATIVLNDKPVENKSTGPGEFLPRACPPLENVWCGTIGGRSGKTAVFFRAQGRVLIILRPYVITVLCNAERKRELSPR